MVKKGGEGGGGRAKLKMRSGDFPLYIGLLTKGFCYYPEDLWNHVHINTIEIDLLNNLHYIFAI